MLACQTYFPGLNPFVCKVRKKSSENIVLPSVVREGRYLDKPSQLSMGKTAKNGLREDKLTSINWAGAGFTF